MVGDTSESRRQPRTYIPVRRQSDGTTPHSPEGDAHGVFDIRERENRGADTGHVNPSGSNRMNNFPSSSDGTNLPPPDLRERMNRGAASGTVAERRHITEAYVGADLIDGQEVD